MAVDVQITDVHFAKLNSLSLRNGMKLQDIIYEAISDYLEKNTLAQGNMFCLL